MRQSQFNLLVKPTSDACIHSCSYCFYLQTQPKDASKRMTLETLAGLTKNYHASVQEPVWEWQGGEATMMGVDFYHEAITQQWKYPSRQPATNSLQTSGTLLDDSWMKLLKGPGDWIVGLSCDGPDNESRGIPTKQITSAAALLKKAGVPYSLLCVVSRENMHKAKEVTQFLSEVGTHVQFLPAQRKEPGGFNPGPSPKEWAAFLQEAHETGGINIGNEMTVAGMKRGMAGDCTHSGCGSYLVVSPNGNVHPCDFFVEPDWNLGNIRDRPLDALMRSKLMGKFKAQHDIIDEDGECETCPILSLCHKGCPRDKFLVEGKFETHSPLCLGTKYLASVT